MQSDNSAAACSQLPGQGGKGSLPYQKLCDQSLSALLSTMSVNLPTTTSASSKVGQVIPVSAEDGRASSHRNSYKEAMVQGFPSGIPYVDNTPASFAGSSGRGKDFHQPQAQPQVVTETGLASKTFHFPSSRVEKDVASEHHIEDADDDDDVFDEKVHTKSSTASAYPRLKRGFSNIVENESLVSEARHSVRADIETDSHNNMYVQTFVLPDLTAYDEDFRSFIEKELVETSTLMSLEQAGRLNWWAELRLCQRLVPLATCGDGNCLLHAASLAMWGFHDRQLILRKELHETLTKAPYKDALYRRWRYQQTCMNKQSGLVFSEAEWEEEWTNILHLASPLPRRTCNISGASKTCATSARNRCEEPPVYESLEEFHVFVLAHVLQRPIIVVADVFLKDSNGDALAPIPFPGIYLPLEVHTCFRSPLLLTYDAAHFSALTPMEQSAASLPHLPAAIPVVDPERRLLPLHFYVDPGTSVDWSKDIELQWSLDDKISLLQKFLNLEWIPLGLIDTNGDLDKGSSGSQDSDESGSMMKDKDKRRDEKKKDAGKTQQVQTVAKQFGSLGKSVGRKLKQLGKVTKGDKYVRFGVGNETAQSLRPVTYNEIQGGGYEYVLVAKLSEKRGKQQQEMIRNYLHNVRARFEADKKKRNDLDFKNRISSVPVIPQITSCSTSTCSVYGTTQANICCSRCYATQEQAPPVRHGTSGNVVYNTFPGRGKQTGLFNKIPEEVLVCGNSKFYTTSTENINTRPPITSLYLNKLTPNLGQNIIPRGRSPPPDYNNCPDLNQNVTDRLPQTSPAPLPRQQAVTENHQMCRNIGCDFYGSHETEGFCSKCYQRVHADSLQSIPQGITKL